MHVPSRHRRAFVRAGHLACAAATVLALVAVLAGCGAATTSKSSSTGGGKLPPVAVPDLIGESQGNASQLLVGAGLTTGRVTVEETTTVTPGLVVRQKPASGTPAQPATAVDMVVAQRPAKGAPVAVPDMIGKNYKKAVAELQALGLSYKAFYDNESNKPQGTIVFQDPQAGAHVPKGTVVQVTISLSPVAPK